MKLFIICCFVVAGWSVSTKAADSAIDALQSLKEKVDSVAADLESYNTDLEGQLGDKLNATMADEKSKMETNMNNTLVNADKLVEEATNAGKNVEDCLKALNSTVRNSKEMTTMAIENCRDSRIDDFEDIRKNVEIHLKTKSVVMERLDEVSKSCENEDSGIAEACLGKEITSLSELAGGYSSSTAELKERAETFIFAAPFKASRCFVRPVDRFNESLSAATASIIECIDNTESEGTF